jgi:UvrD-like helicase C-terminal domain
VLGELAPNAQADGTQPGAGGPDSDLKLVFWQTPDELHSRLLDELALAVGMKAPDDAEGYGRALGRTAEGWVPFDNHSGAEQFQVLSPVRMRDWGTFELNRFLQRHFRGAELRRARQPGGSSYGPEEIVVRDKVMLLTNRTRSGYDWSSRQKTKQYLANGEVGLAARINNGWLNVAFVDRPHLHVGFTLVPASAERVDLELAYALTVHKAQGSEFGTVLVVVPAESRHLSRELMYTAVTRVQKKLVLLVQGNDPGQIYELTRNAAKPPAATPTSSHPGSAVPTPTSRSPNISSTAPPAAKWSAKFAIVAVLGIVGAYGLALHVRGIPGVRVVLGTTPAAR